jgi:SWI/SNF-related matrix-associated actin-dependent regulator 1 of chromatin subfamily A
MVETAKAKFNPQRGVLIFFNAYEIKDLLKKYGFQYNSLQRTWERKITEDDEEFVRKLSFHFSFEPELQEVIFNYLNDLKRQKLHSELEIPVPDGFQYYDFQKAFVEFADKKKYVLLADEMGLGKTVQAAAYINYKQPKYILVVCPAFLKWNWYKELQIWLVNEKLKRNTFILDTKKLLSFLSLLESESLAGLIGIINYDILQNFVEEMEKRDFNFVFDLIIWDESHYIKNLKAKRTKAAFRLLGTREIFMTGTPILNRPDEVFSFLVKAGIYSKSVKDYWRFAYKYCEVEENRFGKKIVGVKDIKGLRRLLSSFMIRRTKKEVLNQLPEKQRILVRFNPESLVKYLELETELFEMRERGLLRVSQSEQEEKIQEMRRNDRFKELSFEEWLTEYKKQCSEFFDGSFHYDGSTLAKLRHLIGLEKVKFAVDFVKNILESEDKVVIMCWHNDVAWYIKEELNKAGIKTLILYGLQNPEERQRVVEEFQKNPEVKAVSCTIKSAGVGLTLIAASTMVFVEQSYVPADILQAEDRIHRIGQEKGVKIYHLVFSSSVDERVVETLNTKINMINQIVDNREMEQFFDKEIGGKPSSLGAAR